MSRKTVFATLLLSVLSAGCDPTHSLLFVNKTRSQSKLKITLEPERKNSYLDELASGDSIVFHLRENDSASIELGIGTWSKKEINKISNSIKKIEFRSENSIENYNSKESIRGLLEENKKGTLIGHNIVIEINE